MCKRNGIGSELLKATLGHEKDGGGVLNLVFKSTAARRRFQADVRKRYGAKRYTAMLGARLISEALGVFGEGK